ncbi:NAD(P)H-dependent oxidoreductase, partial [Escherichia coli]|uniref:NAD(P)H-dependent oxidoreductase n=1 Tax=Escherichia coli TaxID=562 RepID=UPI003AF23B56
MHSGHALFAVRTGDHVMKTLVILSSILGERSHSKQLADHLVARVKQADPAAVVTLRDIGAQPLPYF